MAKDKATADAKAQAKAAKRNSRSELKNISYEIFIALLSILSIFNLVMVYVFADNPPLQQILYVMNVVFSLIFLGDFTYRITTAPSASHYFFVGFGWADLLASLPFPQAKLLRIFRLIRVNRLMRESGTKKLFRTLIRDRANSTLMVLLLLGVLVLEFGSFSILAVEVNAEGANITSASDALWYTVVTISTVGYGDQYPVTNAGRIIGTGIIIVGVGIFGTFTGYLANLFLGPSKIADPAEAEAESQPDADAPAVPSIAATAATDAPAASDALPVPDALRVPAQPAPTIRTTAPEDASRLEDLLALQEQTVAEIRQLVASGRP